MIKNQANIYQFVLRDMIGRGMTGLSPTVRIRKDTGSFASTTNTPTEVSNGLYEVALTATECNCDIMAIEVSLPDGQFPAILTNEYLTTTGGATPAEIWQYNGGRTVDNTIPTVNEIWGRQAGDTTSRTLTNLNIQSELTTYGAAKKSDIPSVAEIQSGLSTFNPTTDTVLIDSIQAAGMVTATGFSTPDNVSTAAEAIINALPSDYAKPSDIPTPPTVAQIWEAETRTLTDSLDIQTELETYGAAKSSDIPTVSDIQDGLATAQGLEDVQNHGDEHWSTDDLNFDISSENREAIAKDVWEYTPRCLTFEPNLSVYCSRSDIERRWGVNNVRQWADLENDNNAARIQMQIDWAILAASERINSDLAASIYKLPFDPVPYAVRRFAATLAGVELYNTRAVNISRDQSNAEIRTALADYSNWITSVLSNVPIVGATLK